MDSTDCSIVTIFYIKKLIIGRNLHLIFLREEPIHM